MEYPKLMVLDAGEYRPVSHLTQILIEDMANSDPDVVPEDFTRVMKTADFQNMLIELEQEIDSRMGHSITQKIMNIVDFMADKLSDEEGN
jgi:hypothetical protein